MVICFSLATSSSKYYNVVQYDATEADFSSFSSLSDPQDDFSDLYIVHAVTLSFRVLLSLTMREGSALTWPGLSTHSLLAQRCDQEKGTQRGALSAPDSVVSNPLTPETHP